MSEFVSSGAGDQTSIRGLRRSIKSALDRIAALILLIVTLPLLLMISLLVSRDGGPVIFGHRRIGRAGAEFQCLKFRTMRTNGEEVLSRFLARNPAAAEEWAANHKLKDDPRVTRIGRLLRVTSLDELPQLLNVLRGDMSMVGPRPIVEAEIKKYGRDIGYYYRVKPGLTGLWQVSGRSTTSYQQRIDYDVSYVKTWSLWLDFGILLRTVIVILTREGSH